MLGRRETWAMRTYNEKSNLVKYIGSFSEGDYRKIVLEAINWNLP